MNENKYKEIISFWFGGNKLYKEYWFDKSIDHIILEKYSELLYNLEKCNIEFYEKNNDYLIALVIIFDQFSRMIYRNNRDKIRENDKIAFSISNFIFETKKDVEYTIEQRIFLLMPYRHKKTKKCLDFVIKKIINYYGEIENYDKKNEYIVFLDRFKMVTYKSYSELEISELEINNEEEYKNINYKNLLDDNVSMIEMKNVEYKNTKNEKLYNVLYDFIINNSVSNVGVSLSGGVDSMVILYLLNSIKKDEKIDNVYAIHIEYSNREESQLETKFLKNYCNSLNVQLFIYKVDYMKRNEIDRVFYEDQTKKIRFKIYSYLTQKYKIKGWCLGHHSGDIVENVLMNIFNGRDILDLGVMKEITYFSNYNVYIYRPLLNNSKEEIYKIASLYNIPYFKDSTPDWSNRGVLRRKVIPSIESQWPLAKEKIFDISKQSDEWNTLIKKMIFNPIKDSIFFNKNTIDFVIREEYRIMPRVLWLNFFLYMFHSIGKKMISNKNLDYFMKTLERNINKNNKFMFSNSCVGSFEKNKLVISYK